MLPVSCRRSERKAATRYTRSVSVNANVDSFMSALCLPVMRLAKNSRASSEKKAKKKAKSEEVKETAGGRESSDLVPESEQARKEKKRRTERS